MPRLEGEVAIITGSGSGIGRASAMLFVAEGARVVHCDVTEGCNETQRMIEANGEESAALILDISDEDAAERLVDLAVKRFGKLTILMNNAGIGCNALAADMTLAEWDHVHDVNVRAQFLTIKRALPAMIAAKTSKKVNRCCLIYCSSRLGRSMP